MAQTNYTGTNALTYLLTLVKQFVNSGLSKKVDIVEGKTLTTNDLTAQLKGNYDKAYIHSQATHAPTNAQANVIETIKVNNTPLTPTGKAVDISIPTKVSQLSNDSGFQKASDVNTAITNKGYQTAQQVQDAINNALSGITGIEFKVVSQLPQSGERGVICLLAHAHGNGDAYDEYIWVSNKWEKIGNTDIDLSAYAKTTDFVEIQNTEIQSIWDSIAV